MVLEKGKKYLQIALNSDLSEARRIIKQLPRDSRIILEAGTPLIKLEGIKAVRMLQLFWQSKFGRVFYEENDSEAFSEANIFFDELVARGSQKISSFFRKTFSKDNTIPKPEYNFSPGRTPAPKTLGWEYVVADLKTADLARWEVQMAAEEGASAAVCLGIAPLETIDLFIAECKKQNIDAMLDMMNVEDPLAVLNVLSRLPQVVILHRGVDEENLNKEREIPFYDIQRLKSSFDVLVAVAGGDDFSEVQRAVLNDADIVVVWKSFYKSTEETARLAEEFLKEIR